MSPEDILKHHKLRRTNGRVAVLEKFSGNNKAFSHSELLQSLASKIDRVTLYRILDQFEKQGILHKIPDDEVSVKYALCDHKHEVGHKHSDDHAHFKCNECGETYCLEESDIPAFKAPQGFKVTEQFLILGGVCAQCH